MPYLLSNSSVEGSIKENSYQDMEEEHYKNSAHRPRRNSFSLSEPSIVGKDSEKSNQTSADANYEDSNSYTFQRRNYSEIAEGVKIRDYSADNVGAEKEKGKQGKSNRKRGKSEAQGVKARSKPEEKENSFHNGSASDQERETQPAHPKPKKNKKSKPFCEDNAYMEVSKPVGYRTGFDNSKKSAYSDDESIDFEKRSKNIKKEFDNSRKSAYTDDESIDFKNKDKTQETDEQQSNSVASSKEITSRFRQSSDFPQFRKSRPKKEDIEKAKFADKQIPYSPISRNEEYNIPTKAINNSIESKPIQDLVGIRPVNSPAIPENGKDIGQKFRINSNDRHDNMQAKLPFLVDIKNHVRDDISNEINANQSSHYYQGKKVDVNSTEFQRPSESIKLQGQVQYSPTFDSRSSEKGKVEPKQTEQQNATEPLKATQSHFSTVPDNYNSKNESQSGKTEQLAAKSPETNKNLSQAIITVSTKSSNVFRPFHHDSSSIDGSVDNNQAKRYAQGAVQTYSVPPLKPLQFESMKANYASDSSPVNQLKVLNIQETPIQTVISTYVQPTTAVVPPEVSKEEEQQRLGALYSSGLLDGNSGI